MLKLRLDAEALAVFGDGLIVASVTLHWPPQRDVVLAVFNGFEHDERLQGARRASKAPTVR